MSGSLTETVVATLRVHAIECTGPGEVTCLACRGLGWMSLFDYRMHIAEQVEAAYKPANEPGDPA
jgi:hypothetical protein